MKLNSNSIQARLYRWFYDVEEMPQSLCPFFWKLVMMWLLLIPFGVFTIPMLIIDSNEKSHFGVKVFGGFLVYVAILLLFTMTLVVLSVFGLTLTENSVLYRMRNTGIAIWCVLIIVSVAFGITKLIDYIKSKRRRIIQEKDWGVPTGRFYYYDESGKQIFIEPKPNILVEMVKAKYNKYCPKITWDNE